jgi:hypothetical protein
MFLAIDNVQKIYIFKFSQGSYKAVIALVLEIWKLEFSYDSQSNPIVCDYMPVLPFNVFEYGLSRPSFIYTDTFPKHNIAPCDFRKHSMVACGL